jgi:hypothetical protein
MMMGAEELLKSELWVKNYEVLKIKYLVVIN